MSSWKEEFLSDDMMMKVLQSVMSSPKSAQQISNECDIPINTVYRKIRAMEEKQLLQTSGDITENGVKTRFFKRNNTWRI